MDVKKKVLEIPMEYEIMEKIKWLENKLKEMEKQHKILQDAVSKLYEDQRRKERIL